MATVPGTPTTFVDGEQVTAALLNAEIRDSFAFLRKPPRVTAFHSADRTLTTATWTLAIFDSEAAGDDSGMHDPAVNNSRLVCRTAGTYLVTAQAWFAGNATGGRGLNITRNGGGARSSTSPVCADGFAAGVANTNQLVSTSGLVDLAVTDYLELFLYQSSGGNLAYIGGAQGTKLSALWVGA